MLVFAGLGNPGAQYANNRHNVGFMAVDQMARRHNFSPWTKKFNALVSKGDIAGEPVLLIKPQTYMNLSGQAIGEALRFYKLSTDALTVFYDELDLVPGKLRVKIGGGHGGHNGIKSIDGHVARDYRRVRIGIGHPGAKELVHHYVLGDFARADETWLNPLLDAIADNADLIVKGDDSTFMNKAALALGSSRNDVAAPSQKQSPAASSAGAPAKPKGQSHIRQARTNQPAVKLPDSGPMASMLKKLFGPKE